MDGIYELAGGIISVINDIFVPLVFALAFASFIFGVFKYFFLGADKPAEIEKGKTLIMYGLGGFFLMISVWGLVRLLTGTFGFEGQARPCLPTFSGKDNCFENSAADPGKIPVINYE
jgi:hypothetical protein